MAGLADLLGTNNPFQQFVAGNRGKLGQLGAGLASGQNFSTGLANAAQMQPEGAKIDDAYATQQKADATRQDQINKTVQYLQQKHPDIAQAVQNGLPIAEGWGEALKRDGIGATANKPIEINGQLVDPRTYRVLGDFRTPTNPNEKAPSGYQIAQDGNLTFIPGGPADPANMGKTTEAQRRNQQLAAVIQPEIKTVEDNWADLSSGTNQAAGMIPGLGGTTSEGYQKARNALTTIAQSYLYSVSGAAAPAEEVNKLVDSVTPKPFESAGSIAEKKRRIRQYADAVIQAGGAAPSPGGAAGGADDPLGLR